ncbi:hypothetical protein IPM65_06155 [Candidatus Roizmanbacteria bacterium]|nr:MAG: hypothetical protein IPM65_06155 [Candidatus Roizmanbacteria bacterium]
MKQELYKPNKGKQLVIDVNGTSYYRYPIKTEVFAKGDDYAVKIARFISTAVDTFSKEKDFNCDWYVIVSEKIVAISQGRSYFIKDIKPSWWAKTLSKYVKKTPHGIGLGSPWTMELAIGEVGLPRILLAAVASVLTKPFGLSGVFYRIAGPQAAAIDGPTSYSLYPSNVSAKLAPKDPQKAATKISDEIKSKLTDEALIKRFKGTVIIDANDLGRNALGNATGKPNGFFEDVMRDNPMGQGSEQTPLVILTL